MATVSNETVRLLAEHDALHGAGAAGGAVAVDERGAELGVALGGFELAGHAGEEALEDHLGFDADDGIVRAAHADIGLVGGAVGSMRSSAVGMWVCVPSTAVTRPSRYQPSATFSLVASAWKSSRMTLAPDARNFSEQVVGVAEGVVAGAHEDAALQVDNGVGLAVGKRALVDAEAGCAVRVVGGAKDAAAAHVRGFGDVMYSKISFLSQMWLPVVMTCAPRSKSSSAMAGVRPKPPAAFSPLMTRRSTEWVSSRWGRCSCTMWRPAEPKISPTNRIFTGRVYMGGGSPSCNAGRR